MTDCFGSFTRERVATTTELVAATGELQQLPDTMPNTGGPDFVAVVSITTARPEGIKYVDDCSYITQLILNQL